MYFVSFISELQTSERPRATEQARYPRVQTALRQRSLKLSTAPASLLRGAFSTAHLPAHFQRTPFYSTRSGEDQITVICYLTPNLLGS